MSKRQADIYRQITKSERKLTAAGKPFKTKPSLKAKITRNKLKGFEPVEGGWLLREPPEGMIPGERQTPYDQPASDIRTEIRPTGKKGQAKAIKARNVMPDIAYLLFVYYGSSVVPAIIS